MWTKDFRVLIFWTVYALEFNSFDYNKNSVDKFVDELLKSGSQILDSEINIVEVQSLISWYSLNRPNLLEILENQSNSWNRTHLIIKALLLCFLVEKNFNSLDDNKKALITEYLRLCQTYIDPQTVALVHAILLKL